MSLRTIPGLRSDNNRTEQPVYLVAGHTTRDLTASGWRIGGSAAYSSIAARRLGLSVRVVTAHASDVAEAAGFMGPECVTLPSRATTTFHNQEKGGGRIQTLTAAGDLLSCGTLSDDWRRPDILHLAPVFREIDEPFVSWFKPRLCGATLQGWMRSVSKSGRVTQELVPDWNDLLTYLDVAIYSEHDIKNNSKWRRSIKDAVGVCVQTLGRSGCSVLESGREHRVPTKPLQIADTTGAGDIFAAAYLSEYLQSGDCLKAARFANEVAGALLMDAGLRDPLNPFRSSVHR